MAEFPRRHLFGLDFVTGTTIPAIADALIDHVPVAGSWRSVVTPNVDHLVHYDHVPSERAVAEASFLLLPDGMPIIWASRLLRRPLDRRLAGSDLFAQLWPRLSARGVPSVMIAPSDQVADLLAEEHPALRTVVPPMFDVADRAAVGAVADATIAAAVDCNARFVFIAISMPKTHVLAAELQRRWADRPEPSPTVMLVGASPEFHLGLATRAPQWMQRIGLEWFHRLLQDPKRLGKRYLVDDMHFLRLVWREWRERNTPE